MSTSRIRKADLYVGSKIKAGRLEHGLSQTALADRLGVTFQQVQKYEKGTNRISAGALFEVAEFLDMPLQWFFPARNR